MVPMEAIARAGCTSIFTTNHYKSEPSTDSADSGYASSGSESGAYNLYFPAPEHLSGPDSLSYHVTTRNLFAWIMEKPLVGFSLGQAMIDLLERLLVVRPATEDSLDDCVAYAERRGYLYMTNHSEYAIAMLAFSEHAEHEQLRNNAFVHCVGMNDALYLSPDSALVSKHTQASITKEALRMDVKVEKVIAALPSFFEEETSRSSLGLTPPQRAHLERFRSFLQSFYVSKYGYWPPPTFTKKALDDLRVEFESLYELLMNRENPTDLPSTSPGGLCVLQNVHAFNRKHELSPLASSLPLVPSNTDLNRRPSAKRGLRKLLSSKTTQQDWIVRAQEGLATAINKRPWHVKDPALVRHYLAFERDSVARLEPDLGVADARKVRWIQIYYSLQMLKSVTDTAPDVILSETPTYHTCCRIPPMVKAVSDRKSALLVHPALRSPTVSSTSAPSTPKGEYEPFPDFDIHPDCESEDYFAPKPMPVRKSSIMSLKSRSLKFGRRLSRGTPTTQHHATNFLSSSVPAPLALGGGPPTPSPFEFDIALQLSEQLTPTTSIPGPFELDASNEKLPNADNALTFAALLRHSSSAFALHHPTASPNTETCVANRRHSFHSIMSAASNALSKHSDTTVDSFDSAYSTPESSIPTPLQTSKGLDPHSDVSWLADIADEVEQIEIESIVQTKDELDGVVEWVDVPRHRVY